MFAFFDSLMDVLSSFSRVLRPLSDFYLALFDFTSILNGWLRPIVNLLDGALGLLRELGL